MLARPRIEPITRLRHVAIVSGHHAPESSVHEQGQTSDPVFDVIAHSAVVLTPLALATAMWDHAPAMYDQIQVADAEWPRFEDDEMRDLATYLRRQATASGAADGDN